MTLRLTLFLLFLLPISLSAQKKMKFGKIPSEDLKMTVYERDTSAAALVLGETGKLFFDFTGQDTETRLEIHRRIKILKRAGFNEGDISIRYYSQNKSSDVTGLKVKVFNPDGSNIDVSKKDIFTEKVSDYVSAKKFSAPQLTEGSIIDYKYTISSSNIFSLYQWFFQEDIPVRFSEYTVKIPEAYKYVTLKKGGPINNDLPERTSEAITYDRGTRQTGLGTATIYVEETRYYAENLPAMREQNYLTTMEDYLANIQFQLSSIEFPMQPIRPIMTSWEKIEKELLENKNFGSQYLKSMRHYKVVDIAAPKIAEGITDTDKMKIAYNFVLDNMEWNDYYEYLTDKDLNKTYEEKSGSSADMNLMLLALLKNAGIKANPVLISTRNNGKPIEIYPFLRQFNHVIILAEVDGKSYFLDATEKNRPVGYIEINSLNKRGWMLGDGQKWVDIKALKSGDVIMANLVLNAEGNLEGDFVASCSGYSAFNEREIAEGDKIGKYWQKRLSETHEEAEVLEVSYEGMGLNDKNMKAKVTCNIPEAAQVNGDFMYISPIIYSGFDENPFKLENRLYPVEIPYPFKEQLIVNLTIPEGYTVEELPEQINLSLPNKGGKYQYLISQNENVLQIICKMQLSQLTFLPEEYKSIKGFFDIMLEKRGEQIVLKKI